MEFSAEGLVTPIQALLASCANLALLDPPPFSAELEPVRETLENLWYSLAGISTVGKKCTVDEENLGYVKQGAVLVPCYLLDDVPGPEVLSNIADLAAQVRLGVGTICLSGSACLLGTVQFIGDIDYCEYVAYGTKSGARGLGERVATLALSTAMPLCESVKFLAGSWSGPWRCPDAWKEDETVGILIGCIENGAQQLKLDFVTDLSPLGVVEATNVALFLHADDEQRAIGLSYAAQEMPIADGEFPLARPLADPIQLGRYINFLLGQVQSYRTANTVKALKRALSLARILLLSDTDIVRCLTESTACVSTALDARVGLDRRLAASVSPPGRSDAVARLRERLGVDIRNLEQAKRSETRTKMSHDEFAAFADSALATLLDTAYSLIAAP